MTSPLLFDRALQRRRLARAIAAGFEDFLIARAVADLGERLGPILREFSAAADIGTPTPHAARLLAADPRVGGVLRLAPVAEAPDPAYRLAVADEEILPLASGSLALAVSIFALQGVNDFPGTLVQIRRALRPDGLFIACLPGGETLTELRQTLAQAESECEGGVSPRVAPFADIRDCGALLQRAGFALPVTDSDQLTVRYSSLFHLMRDLRAMGWTNAMLERRKKPLARATLLRAAAIYADRFADADGRVRATFELVWMLGWAPHDSQQKPLRPGSARTRLADALGVREYGAGEKARP